MKRTTLGALLFAGVLAAGCGASAAAGGSGSVKPASALPDRSTAAVAVHPTTTSPLVAGSPPPPATTTNRISGGPPTRAPECLPITANFVGCPPLLRPQPIVPQPGHPSLTICQPLPLEALRFPPGMARMIVCGRGFRPGELVTITVVGRRGSVIAAAGAGPDGIFRSALPPTTCQVMPLYAVARGNHGSVSNALPVLLPACNRG